MTLLSIAGGARMNIDEQVKNHRAIEALRNGVPNRDAVKVWDVINLT